MEFLSGYSEKEITVVKRFMQEFNGYLERQIEAEIEKQTI